MQNNFTGWVPMFRFFGNIALGLAVLLYAIPLRLVGDITSTPGEEARSNTYGLGLVLLPLWTCLTIALCVSTGAGGLDWLPLAKGAQYVAVVGDCAAMGVVTWWSGAMRAEAAHRIPWSVRPLVPRAWAMWTFPLVVWIYCMLTINPGLGAAVPRVLLHAALAVVGGFCLLVASVGLYEFKSDRFFR